MPRRTQSLIWVLLSTISIGQVANADTPEGLFGPARNIEPSSNIVLSEGNDTNRAAIEAALGEGGKATEDLSEQMLDGYEMGDMEPIPSPRMIAVEDKNTGKMGFISANGRYYIEGTIVDLWNGEHLKTVKDVRDSRQHVDAQALKFPSKATFQFGEGPIDVVIFSDPYCEICQEMMAEAKEISETSKQYRFSVVKVPALGKASLPAVQRMWCGGATDDVLLAASITGDLSKIRDKGECDYSKMGGAFVSADMLGVDAVPTLIGPDGHLARGLKTSLKSYLQKHSGDSE